MPGSMIRAVLIAGLLFEGFAFAAEVPSDFLLTVEIPRTSRVEIHVVREKKGFAITYAKFGKSQDRKFSESIVSKLFGDLWSSTPPYEQWPTDIACTQMHRWQIKFDGKTRQVCRREKIEKALLRFQNSISQIFR